MKNYLNFYIPQASKPSVLGLLGSKIKDIEFHSNTKMLISDINPQLALVEVWGQNQEGCDLAFRMTMHSVEHNKASLAQPVIPQHLSHDTGVLDDIFTFLSEVESKKC